MTSIFLAQAPDSASYASQLRQKLENKGYTVPVYPSVTTASYTSRIERAILGSAAVVLLWSSEAHSPEWEDQHIRFAQRFSKPIYPLLLDATPLPDTLAATTTFSGQLPLGTIVAALLTLPDFPPPHSADTLLKLHEQITNETIHVRKTAIETAADMLTHNQHREAVVALLTYVAENDPVTNIQKDVRKVLEFDARRRIPSPPFSNEEAKYIFGVRCDNGHVSYFDKRVVCKQYRDIVHGPETAPNRKDELHLPCQTQGCGLTVVAYIDCGGEV